MGNPSCMHRFIPLTIITLLDVAAVSLVVTIGISAVAARLGLSRRRTAGSGSTGLTAAGLSASAGRLARRRGSAASVVFLVFRFVVLGLKDKRAISLLINDYIEEDNELIVLP